MRYPSLQVHKYEHMVVLAVADATNKDRFQGVVISYSRKDKDIKLGHPAMWLEKDKFEPYPYEITISNKRGLAKVVGA